MMTTMDELVIICFMLILLSIMAVIGLFAYTRDSQSSFLFSVRKRKIDWKKVGKWYLYLQGFCLFCSINNPNMGWVMTMGMPIILIGLLLITYFFSMNGQGDTKELNSSEFQEYNKAYIRDEKLRKILK